MSTKLKQARQQLLLTPQDKVNFTQIAEDAAFDFDIFVNHIFCHSTDIFKNKTWVGGEFISMIAQWLQEEPATIRVSARDHFKSMSFYAHIMWKIYRMNLLDLPSREIQYFSYVDGMAAYHLNKIKNAIRSNPMFNDCIDLKPRAEGVLAYQWVGQDTKLTVTPRGLLSFKRGVHSNDVYVDDPFQDPENKLVPTKIEKINDVMKKQILDMYQDELHVAGTAQTNSDFFFDTDFTSGFSVKILPAIVNEKEKKVLWKEWVNWDQLMQKKRQRGPKIFAQEYMCSPVYSEESYLNYEKLDAAVNPSLKRWTMAEFDSYYNKLKKEEENTGNQVIDFDVIGGFDIGKKTHPSHFSIFMRKGKKWTQLFEVWLEHMDYVKQIDLCRSAVEMFHMDYLFYDNTRGEFESLAERGELPAEMVPIHFTFKKKHALAMELDRLVENGDIEFLEGQRQIDQMKIVNNDLQAPETPQGHGDSFFSNALCMCALEGEIEMEEINISTLTTDDDDDD